MSDRVFPSTKPAANGTAAAAATNGTAAPTANGNGVTVPSATKSHLYNPTSRPPYRPQPHHRRPRPSCRKLCCCCCFWTTLVILLLLLVATIAGAALYVFYRPHRPTFSIPSIRIHRLNLTSAADSSSAHLAALFNLTIISKNPNSHLTFLYDPFTVSSFTSTDNVFIGNGTLPAFSLGTKNETSFKNVVVSGSNDLDTESVNSLRSDMKKKDLVRVKMVLDTKVKVRIGRWRTKKVGIRVTCDGIKGSVPKGKSPTVAITSGVKCKVDLRIKIWKLTF